MRRAEPENQEISDDNHCEGFALSVGQQEARRQLLAGGAMSGFIFLALLTSVLFGTT
jgi:hypothetical protein